jgi:hypothetical protein
VPLRARELLCESGVGGASINFIRPWLLAAGLLGKWLADCQCMIGSGGMHQSALARCEGLDCFPTTLAELVYAPLSTPASDKVEHGGWVSPPFETRIGRQPIRRLTRPFRKFQNSHFLLHSRLSGPLQWASVHHQYYDGQKPLFGPFDTLRLCNLAECWGFGLVTVGIETKDGCPFVGLGHIG